MLEGSCPNPVTTDEVLRLAASSLTQSQTPLLDARILLKHALETDDAGLIARGREALTGEDRERFGKLIARRSRGEPVAYITGVKEFWSLEFKVTPDVLIPRDDTGALIEAAISRRGREESLRIADLGAGSGCLLCALLSEFPAAEGVGIDISPAALAVAADNAQALGLERRARFTEGSWLEALDGRFDLIVANPPYIALNDRAGLARDIGDFEPEIALFAGEDGLDAFRAILPQIPSRLSNDGLVIMECGSGQATSLKALLAEISGDAALFTVTDLAGRPRGAGFDRRERLNSGQKKD